MFMPAGRGDFEGAFGGLLAAHLAKVDAVMIVVDENVR